jgi:hypothetical protein
MSLFYLRFVGKPDSFLAKAERNGEIGMFSGQSGLLKSSGSLFGIEFTSIDLTID